MDDGPMVTGSTPVCHYCGLPPRGSDPGGWLWRVMVKWSEDSEPCPLTIEMDDELWAVTMFESFADLPTMAGKVSLERRAVSPWSVVWPVAVLAKTKEESGE